MSDSRIQKVAEIMKSGGSTLFWCADHGWLTPEQIVRGFPDGHEGCKYA